MKLGIQISHGLQVDVFIQLFEELSNSPVLTSQKSEQQGFLLGYPKQNADIGKLAGFDVWHESHNGVVTGKPSHFQFLCIGCWQSGSCPSGQRIPTYSFHNTFSSKWAASLL